MTAVHRNRKLHWDVEICKLPQAEFCKRRRINTEIQELISKQPYNLKIG